MQYEYSGQLLDHAFLRLSPDVFFHPVWTHFVEAGALLSREQIQSLLGAGDDLVSAGNLIEACQILFICAFQQLRAGNYTAASSHIQRILLLTEQHALPQVAWWATWGAAAVCVRRGWFRQAAEHLAHLQSLLSQQQEWVLSDVIDVIRRALLSQTQTEFITGQPPSSDSVLSSAFEQMLQWGTPHATSAMNSGDSLDDGGHTGQVPPPLSGTSGFTWGSLWNRIKHVVRGELRLKWVEASVPTLLLHVDERNVPTVYSTVMLPLPASIELPPQPDQMSRHDQLPIANHDQLSKPDQLSALEHNQVPAFTHHQPTEFDQRDSANGPTALPSITARLLGTFSFSVNNATAKTWPTGKGRAVLKYLLAHHTQPIPRDILMDAFWPQAGPEAARNSLNVALYGLRQALKIVTDKPVVLFEEGAYCISPEFHVWVDIDEFDRYVQVGRRFEAKDQPARAVVEYEAAVELYQGDFLSGDLYEEWPVLARERLRVAYLDVLDHLSQIYFNQDQYAYCVTLCQLLLTRDTCREDIHCLLMRCYSREGQHHLALRQYQACVEALRTELDVAPAPTTAQLYERIRRRERV